VQNAHWLRKEFGWQSFLVSDPGEYYPIIQMFIRLFFHNLPFISLVATTKKFVDIPVLMARVSSHQSSHFEKELDQY
jgi:hypothetical protein